MLPNKFKLIGLVLLLPGLIIGYFAYFENFEPAFLLVKKGQNLIDEFCLSFIITGFLLLTTAKEKQEDEYIRQLRLNAWMWAVTLNLILLLLFTWTVYNFTFIDVLVYNTFSVPVFFLLKFYWSLKQLNSEK